jgi:excisionase family DNA binding protein
MTASARFDAMATDEVARELGVSVRQVQRLVETGELVGIGRVGRSLLIDARSVNLLQANGAQRGRPWNQRTVWVALDLLSGVETGELTRSQRWHLLQRLRAIRAPELVRLGRRRADVQRFRVSESFLARVRAEVTLTGAAAVGADMDVARRFGLAAAGRPAVDGYIGRDRVDRVVSGCYLAEDTGGNVTLRVIDDSTRAERGGAATIATIALDLAESIDPRERSAGRHVLDQLLTAL